MVVHFTVEVEIVQVRLVICIIVLLSLAVAIVIIQERHSSQGWVTRNVMGRGTSEPSIAQLLRVIINVGLERHRSNLGDNRVDG
jgi:hypothetical protein